jgi:hypothetical protein
MAPTKRRSSASAAISQSAIEQVGSILKNLPEKPKENLSLREVVSELHSAITTALGRGYSYDEVVAILADQGVEITVASLKRYLAAARKESTTKSKQTKRGTRSRTASLSQPTEVFSSAPAADVALNGAAAAEPAAPARKRRSATPTKASTQPAAKSKTAAKAKPTPRAKTTSRSTSSRGRRRSSDTAS